MSFDAEERERVKGAMTSLEEELTELRSVQDETNKNVTELKRARQSSAKALRTANMLATGGEFAVESVKTAAKEQAEEAKKELTTASARADKLKLKVDDLSTKLQYQQRVGDSITDKKK